jgi:hypothetical protein
MKWNKILKKEKRRKQDLKLLKKESGIINNKDL